jgi:hypothetical protein|tara:strand:- start:165 stop:485 length:321 start_codon:yes stop_codon:yes gene_type:complete
MTKERYFKMCEQLNKEPIQEEIPPDFEDLPETAKIAITIFNSLGDRIFPDVGYTGKDYTTFDHYLDIYAITDEKELLLDILTYLESRAITASRESIKRAHDKLKRK